MKLQLNRTHQLLVYANCANYEKIKHLLLCRQQNTDQNHDTKIRNRFPGNLSQFKYFGTTVTVQNFLSSRLLYTNVKIGIYKTVIFPVVLCGCETWSLNLREEDKLRTVEKSMLGRISGPKRYEVTRGWRIRHKEEWHNLCSSPSIIRVIRSKKMIMTRDCSTNTGREECT
jgi:hypothetical protein